MIEKVKEFIHNVLSNKTDVERMVLNHLLITEEYVRFLYKKITDKDASEELRIAALGHDIERAFRDEKIYENMYKSEKGFLDIEFLKYHQKRSAEILSDFLRKNNYPEDKIKIIYKMVLNHEFGGDFDTNILKDADSISFFINNAEHFIKVKTKESSPDKVLSKLEWMYNRITSPEAKKIAYKFYGNSITRLKS